MTNRKGHPIALSVDELMARARQLTGIDIIDHEIVEPLRMLHRSLCEDACLHAEGAKAQQDKLLRLLSNRLRMQRDFAAHPEIADEKITAPVFVMGMGRSGTTKTQKVLAASGDFNFIPFWKAYNWALLSGSRDESPEARIREADEYCRWFDRLSPETKTGHSFETHEPEEETTLNEGCFRTVSFMGYAEVWGYIQWIAPQSAGPMFEFLRDCLKYLQWQGLASGSKRWLLKAPIYYGLEPDLLRVFPDAKLVMTHRSPLQTVPSSCRLIELFHQPFDDAPLNALPLAAGFPLQMNQHLAHRAQPGGLPILDLHFDEVNRSMETAIDKIYAFAGMALSDTARHNMQQWGVEHPMHQHGKFQYALETYGLSETQIRHDFAAYLEFLRAKFGKDA